MLLSIKLFSGFYCYFYFYFWLGCEDTAPVDVDTILSVGFFQARENCVVNHHTLACLSRSTIYFLITSKTVKRTKHVNSLA
jgi:hypothetical protein